MLKKRRLQRRSFTRSTSNPRSAGTCDQTGRPQPGHTVHLGAPVRPIAVQSRLHRMQHRVGSQRYPCHGGDRSYASRRRSRPPHGRADTTPPCHVSHGARQAGISATTGKIGRAQASGPGATAKLPRRIAVRAYYSLDNKHRRACAALL